MIYLITNVENYGIIYFTQDRPVIANLIASSFLDCYVRPISEKHPSSNLFTLSNNEQFNNSNYKIEITSNKISKLEDSAVNDLFLKNKHIAGYRANAFEFLLSCVQHTWNKTITFPYPEINSLINQNLSEDSNFVNVYSEAHEIDKITALNELKMFADSDNLVKMRIYSHFQTFVKEISNIKTEEEIQPIKDKILHRYFKNAAI